MKEKFRVFMLAFILFFGLTSLVCAYSISSDAPFLKGDWFDKNNNCVLKIDDSSINGCQ